ncbi:MAG: hypothetical protein H7336_13010 [Bacteriovorax sp.]|nr:hypothetical protein [Bacteriovorax sp.]
MKSLIAALFAIPVLAFGSTCYQATTPVYGEVPARLCLDKIVASNSSNELIVVSYDRFPSILTITETSRHNEDRVNFTAEAVIADVWESGCGDGFKATLKVKSEMTYGEISEKYLDLSVETETTNDTCHSQPQTEVIKYEIVK